MSKKILIVLAAFVALVTQADVAFAQPHQSSRSGEASRLVAEAFVEERISLNSALEIDGSEVKAEGFSMAVPGAVRLPTAIPQVKVLHSRNVDHVVRPLSDGFQVVSVVKSQRDEKHVVYDFGDKFLELMASGAVVVRVDRLSEPVALIDVPWAKDASGGTVPTRYRVSGSTLVQEFSTTSSTKYPVIADPRVRTAWYGFSVDFTRAESIYIAGNALACAGIVPNPVLKPACGAIASFATVAVGAGNCVSVKYLSGMPPGLNIVWWAPRCYA